MRNNILDIFGIDTAGINLFPQTTAEEIIQNVSVLLTTVVGSVPLDRRLGLNPIFIDEPQARAMMELRIFAIQTLQDYEPRVEVTEVDFVPRPDNAQDGRLYPRAVVRILDEFII